MSGFPDPMAEDRKTAATCAPSRPPPDPSSFGSDTETQSRPKGFKTNMQKKHSAVAAALALAVFAYATNAGAIIRPSITDAVNCPATVLKLCLTASVPNLTWGDDPGEEEVVLDLPLFITSGATLTSSPASRCSGIHARPRRGRPGGARPAADRHTGGS